METWLLCILKPLGSNSKCGNGTINLSAQMAFRITIDTTTEANMILVLL